ncbi:MAG: OmpA family protein [Bacteroidota bacterium]
MKKFFLIFLISIKCVCAYAQTWPIRFENADCSKPIVLNDTVYGPTSPVINFGSVQEFSSNGYQNSQYFPDEIASVWYSFKAPCDGMLTFEICPLNKGNDYDFMLFRDDGTSDICSKIQNKTLKPVRACISRNDKNLESKTGLSKTAQTEYAQPGPGPSFVKALPVKSGDCFLLALNNVSPNPEGHKLTLHYGCKVNVNKFILNISAFDATSKEPLKAEYCIFEPGKNNLDTLPVFSDKDKEKTQCQLEKNTTYKINVFTSGYLWYTQRVVANSYQNNIEIKAPLIKLEAGKSINFDNIYFYAGSDMFLPAANTALLDLYATMLRNPGLKISINGHVNAPGDINTLSHQSLSENRALAVYNYLVSKGIDKNRMTHQGFGNTKMLYPDAYTETQAAKNRRVEIVVISVQ